MSISNSCTILALISLFGLGLNAVDAQTSPTLPEDIVVALNNNVSDLESLSLVWQCRYSTELDFQNLCKQLNYPDFYGFYEPINQIFMWQGGAFYYHRSHRSLLLKSGNEVWPNAWELNKDSSQLKERIDDYAFDGNKFYIGNGPDSLGASAALAIFSRKQINDEIVPCLIHNEYPLFIGLKFPMGTKEIGNRHKSSILDFAETGTLLRVSKEIRRGENVTMVEVRAINLWEGKERIHQFNILSLDRKLAYCIQNDEFVNVSQTSLYLPKQTSCVHYTYYQDNISSTPLFKENFRLVEFSTKKINKSQFELSRLYSKPGTRIANKILNDTEFGLQYDVPANPADLDRVIDSALTGTDFTPPPLPSRAAMVIRWIIILVGLGMILYAGYRKFIQKI
ncbi:MAG: hypothetical protein LBJ67_17010 [Planctomycetaceae bacterium]|jgi:hypothetical protein|nr:hypothetical protein [Planctomycetaceae bacterium]